MSASLKVVHTWTRSIAYVIVRHVKFVTKKGGKKASQAIEDAGKRTRSTVSESHQWIVVTKMSQLSVVQKPVTGPSLPRKALFGSTGLRPNMISF
jgi:hypothetical protein